MLLAIILFVILSLYPASLLGMRQGQQWITSRNHVKIMDFGIARELDKKSITATATVIGTPHYMSPEHLDAKTVQPASDVYSMGVILYEMLAGELPFDAPDLMGVIMKMMSREPEPLAKLRPDLPPELCAVVHRMFDRDTDVRYATAGEVLADLSPWAPATPDSEWPG